MLKDAPLWAVDVTSLESRYTSRYYVQCKGYKRFLHYEWPKVTAVIDCDTHCRLYRDPRAKQRFTPIRPGCSTNSKFANFEAVLADAGYDGEHNHRLCREQLGIAEVMIPLNKCRNRKWPKTEYRRQMKNQFDKGAIQSTQAY